MDLLARSNDPVSSVMPHGAKKPDLAGGVLRSAGTVAVDGACDFVRFVRDSRRGWDADCLFPLEEREGVRLGEDRRASGCFRDIRMRTVPVPSSKSGDYS